MHRHRRGSWAELVFSLRLLHRLGFVWRLPAGSTISNVAGDAPRRPATRHLTRCRRPATSSCNALWARTTASNPAAPLLERRLSVNACGKLVPHAAHSIVASSACQMRSHHANDRDPASSAAPQIVQRLSDRNHGASPTSSRCPIAVGAPHDVRVPAAMLVATRNILSIHEAPSASVRKIEYSP